jgi:hypothetical protein
LMCFCLISVSRIQVYHVVKNHPLVKRCTVCLPGPGTVLGIHTYGSSHSACCPSRQIENG